MSARKKTTEAKAKKPRAKRRLAKPSYRSFRLTKKLKHNNTDTNLASTKELLIRSFTVLRVNWRFFGGIALIYGVLLLVFVRGVGGGIDIEATKQSFSELVGQGNQAASTLALFGVLLSGGDATNNEIVSLYQTIFVIVTSLAVVWGLRQAQSDNKTRLQVKDAFYKGMQPLIPVLLVLMLVTIQLSLISIAASIYTTVIEGGIAVLGIEKALWLLLIGLIILLALYLLSSSVLALYIVTLPNMTPLRSLRAAKKLVEHRRFAIIRRLLLMGIILMLLFGLVVIPAIAYVPVIAEPLFFLLSIVALPFIHAYVYNMYRSML